MTYLIETPKQAWAKIRVVHWWNELNRVYGSNLTPYPAVKFDRSKKTAGKAWGVHNVISLSNHFLHNEVDFDRTIAHEVCHVYVDRFYGARCIHDWRWAKAMKLLGLSAERCHAYESTPATVHRDSTLVFSCKCNAVIRIGKKVQNNIVRGMKYRCRKCNILFTGDML
jgi:predicted SprT family Zn-dependent metalloprotease